MARSRGRSRGRDGTGKASSPSKGRAPGRDARVAPRFAAGGAPGIQPKLRVGRPGDRYEQEANGVADRVVAGERIAGSLTSVAPGSLGGAVLPDVQRQPEEEEAVQTQAEEEEEAVQTQVEEEEEAVQTQVEEEEEAVQTQVEEEEEAVQSQTEEEDQAVQTQMEEEGEPVQTQVEEEEEAVQSQTEEEEEPVQGQAEEEEEAVQTQAEEEDQAVQSQTEEEEEAVQAQMEEEEEPVQTQAEEEEEPVQGQADEEEQPVRRQVAAGEVEGEERRDERPVLPASRGSSGPGAPGTSVARAVRNTGGGSPMDPGTRGVLDSRMGADFGGVRVHTGGDAHAATSSIRARAFTYRNHIWLGRGESQSNLRLMAHEATHVLQQGSAVRRAPEAVDVTPSRPAVRGGFWDTIKGAASSVVRTVSDLAAAAKKKLLSAVKSFARDIPGYPLLTVLLGKDPITDEEVERTPTNVIRGFMSLIPGGNKIFERIQKSGALQRTFSWIEEQWTRLDLSWSKIKGLFKRAWESLSVGDVASPSKAFEKIKKIFKPPLRRLLNFVSAVAAKVKEFIFEAALKLAGPMAEKVMGMIRKGGAALSAIFNDPIGFLSNLIKAVRLGFQQFSKNIWTHLKKGLMGWLFGALEGAGLELPEKFDLKGIVSLVLQILGLTYDRFRARLVKRFGEKRVARIEKAVEFVRILVTEGVAAAWKKIVEYLGNLKEMVFGAIRNWVVTRIVKAAVTKLVSMFNPVGAIIQAVITIYNTVMFFIERFKQIVALANSVFESINNIAAGKLKNAANYVEQTMGRTIPVILSFLARLIGLGGISSKIKTIIGRIHAKMDRVYDRLIDYVAKIARKVVGLGKKGVAAAAKKIKDAIFPPREVKVAGESHRVVAKRSAGLARVELQSETVGIESFLARAREANKTDEGKVANKDVQKRIERIEDNHEAFRKEKDEQKQEKLWAALVADIPPVWEHLLKNEKVPRSVIAWQPKDSRGRAQGVIADPLTKEADKEGSQPETTELPGWASSTIPGRRGHPEYGKIRGHILHGPSAPGKRNLHGPGKDFNLTPISNTTNQRMFSRAEEQALDWLDENPGAKLRYEVKVYYPSEPENPQIADVAEKLTVTVKDKESGKSLEKQSTYENITGAVPEAEIQRVPVDLNDEDHDDRIADIEGIGPRLAERIIEKREELGGFYRYDQLAAIEGMNQGKIDALRESDGVVLGRS